MALLHSAAKSIIPPRQNGQSVLSPGVSPHALSPRTRSKCAAAVVQSTLFWHNYGPILFHLPLEKSSWALRLISMICIEEWFMTSFGLEMQGRIWGLWRYTCFKCEGADQNWLALLQKTIPTGAEIQIRNEDGFRFCMKAKRQKLWKGEAAAIDIKCAEQLVLRCWWGLQMKRKCDSSKAEREPRRHFF